MATLRELSEKTGFSMATISRILNNDATMNASAQTRQKVLAAAGELNYAATKSRKGRAAKPMLRVGVAEMLTPAEQLQDTYYLYLKSYVEQACAGARYETVPLRREGERFAHSGAPLDGVIAIGIFTPGQLDSLREITENLVFLDSSPDETRCDSVVINFRLGMRQALDHLWGLGHREIGFLGPRIKYDDRKRPSPEVRRTLFAEYMQARGLLRPAYFFDTDRDGADAAELLWTRISAGEPMPTALLAANETAALGALRALCDCNLHVPADMSLISFNDTPVSALIEPPLTSVSTHVQDMGRCAVRLVAERAQRAGRPPVRLLPEKVVIPSLLTERESTAPPRR